MILTHICITVLRFITLLHIYYTLSYLFIPVGSHQWSVLLTVTFRVWERACWCCFWFVFFIKDKTAETEAGFLSLSGCLLCKCLSSCRTNWINTWGGGRSSAAVLSFSGSFWPYETVTHAVTPKHGGKELHGLFYSSAEETLEPPLGKEINLSHNPQRHGLGLEGKETQLLFWSVFWMFGVELVRLVRIQESVLTVTLKGAGLQSGWSFSPAAPWRQVRAGERHSVPTERERWKEASSCFSQSEDKRRSQVSSCCSSLFLLFVGRGVNGPENKTRRGRGGGRMERTERRPVGNCHLTDERLTDRWESRPPVMSQHDDSKCRNKNNH